MITSQVHPSAMPNKTSSSPARLPGGSPAATRDFAAAAPLWAADNPAQPKDPPVATMTEVSARGRTLLVGPTLWGYPTMDGLWENLMKFGWLD